MELQSECELNYRSDYRSECQFLELSVRSVVDQLGHLGLHAQSRLLGFASRLRQFNLQLFQLLRLLLLLLRQCLLSHLELLL